MKRDKTAYKSLYHDKNKKLKAALTSEMHFLILCDVVNEMSRMKIFSIHLFYLISYAVDIAHGFRFNLF